MLRTSQFCSLYSANNLYYRYFISYSCIVYNNTGTGVFPHQEDEMVMDMDGCVLPLSIYLFVCIFYNAISHFGFPFVFCRVSVEHFESYVSGNKFDLTSVRLHCTNKPKL